MDSDDLAGDSFILDTLKRLQNISVTVEELKLALLQQATVRDSLSLRRQKDRNTYDNGTTFTNKEDASSKIEGSSRRFEPESRQVVNRRSYSGLTLQNKRFSAPQHFPFRNLDHSTTQLEDRPNKRIETSRNSH